MKAWLIVPLILEIGLILLYISCMKRYPILCMPFDYQYRVFKRAYRAYAPVRDGQKLYKVFAEDFLYSYKRFIEGKRRASSEEFTVANRICNIIENHQAMVERYFAQNFNYSDYLNLKSEYDLYKKQVIESVNKEPEGTDSSKLQRNISLRRKVLLFESLFRICHVDVSNAQKGRFIRDLLEVEPNTKEISNTNTYKYIKEKNKELLAKGEITARIKDYEYVAQQLENLGLERERTIILGEIKELKTSITE